MFKDLPAGTLLAAALALCGATLGGCDTRAAMPSGTGAAPRPPSRQHAAPEAPFDETVITPAESAGAPRSG
jgi:hypothetical protein